MQRPAGRPRRPTGGRGQIGIETHVVDNRGGSSGALAPGVHRFCRWQPDPPPAGDSARGLRLPAAQWAQARPLGFSLFEHLKELPMAGTKDQIEGKVREVKGKITHDQAEELTGKAQGLKGKAEATADEAK